MILTVGCHEMSFCLCKLAHLHNPLADENLARLSVGLKRRTMWMRKEGIIAEIQIGLKLFIPSFLGLSSPMVKCYIRTCADLT